MIQYQNRRLEYESWLLSTVNVLRFSEKFFLEPGPDVRGVGGSDPHEPQTLGQGGSDPHEPQTLGQVAGFSTRAVNLMADVDGLVPEPSMS
jgi:hypothetical protein